MAQEVEELGGLEDQVWCEAVLLPVLRKFGLDEVRGFFDGAVRSKSMRWILL